MEKLSGRVTFVNIPRSGEKMYNIHPFSLFYYFSQLTFTYLVSIYRNPDMVIQYICIYRI